MGILTKGNRIAKYFGEDQVGTRQVETTLKLYDCGHFYMKQTLPGSGATPYQIIFEGRLQENDRGIHLEYLLRYTGQTSKRADLDLSVQVLPPNQETFFAACGECDNKNQLNGLIPAIVGEDEYCRVEVFRDGDVIEKAPARFNEECFEPQPWRESAAKRKNQASSATASSSTTTAPTMVTATTTAPMPERKKSGTAAAGHEQTEPPGTSRTETYQTPEHKEYGCQYKDEEPLWPLLVGLGCFILLIGFFGWLNWQEWNAKDADGAEEEL